MAQSTALPNGTVHRLLAQLLDLRLATRLEGSRVYAIGPLAYELGLVAAQQFDIRKLCAPAMERLAAESAETIYLVQRSSHEEVCIDLQEGPTAVRVAALQIGSRRPLGLGAGGLAMLAAMPSDEVSEVLAAVMPMIEREWRFPEADLRRSLDLAREQGHAVIRNRITPGVTAISKSFNDSLGRVFGAVTIAGLNTRLTDKRIEALRVHLNETARTIERALRGHQWARYETRFESA